LNRSTGNRAFRSRELSLLWLVALVLGFVLRAVPLTAARPYIAYIDEGNFLHPAFRLLSKGGWDSRSYLYPQFPVTAFAGVARALDPVYRVAGGQSLFKRIPARVELYEDLEPFALLLIARSLSVSLGLAVIVLTGLLAGRLAGARAGAAAALLAALTPALVLRGSIATVDPYAALFVLLSAYLTDLVRTSTRPGIVSVAAGAAAGAAFASKYPSALVIVAFGVSTLLQPVRLPEKARRSALATLGLVLGAAGAMPAIVNHPLEVWKAITMQAAFYREGSSVSLWQQVFFRAEPTFAYERAELGFLFVVLAIAGLIFGLRDRRISSTLWGWCALVTTLLFLYGSQAQQPFRNLLPLVPLACVTASIFVVRVRQRVRSPRWVDAVAVAWVLLAFAAPLSRYAKDRHQLEDTRQLAMDWLVAHCRSGDQVLLSRELGFLTQELARLPARTMVRWWENAQTEIPSVHPRFVVTGVLERTNRPPIDVAALPAIRSDYDVHFCLGKQSTPADNFWWRGNHQIVSVLERKSAGLNQETAIESTAEGGATPECQLRNRPRPCGCARSDDVGQTRDRGGKVPRT
jgi:hypothetical protein